MNRKIRNIGVRVRQKAGAVRDKASLTVIRVTNSASGAMYVDEGGNMLIAVVVGMLLLVAIYGLFKNNIIPNITTKSNAMFNYLA